jgi:hypothetical protein
MNRHFGDGRIPLSHCGERPVNRTADGLGAHFDDVQDITEAQPGCLHVRIRSATRVFHRSTAGLLVSRVLRANLPPGTVHRGPGTRSGFGKNLSESSDVDEPDIDAARRDVSVAYFPSFRLIPLRPLLERDRACHPSLVVDP